MAALGLTPVGHYLPTGIPLLTVDRFLLLFLIACFGFNIGKFLGHDAARIVIAFVFLVVISSFSSFLLNPNSYLETFVAYIYFSLYFLVSFFVFSRHKEGSESYYGRDVFYDVIKIWSLWAILFSIWAVYNQVFLGSLFYDTFSTPSAGAQARYKTMMAGGRLFLPFPTAPVLGFMCFGFALVLLIDKRKKGISYSKFNIFLILALLAIGFATQSRSAAYAFILAFCIISFGQFLNILKPRSNVGFKRLVFGIGLTIISIFSIYYMGDYLTRLEFDVLDILESRHFSIRAKTVDIIMMSDFPQFFFGHGVGTLIDHDIAPYTFTSYLTAFYEIGLVGMVFYVLLVFIPVFFVLSRKVNFGSEYFYGIFEALGFSFFIVVANLFYEFKLSPVMAIFLAYGIYMALLKCDPKKSIA